MIERVHEHIIDELAKNTTTDTIFVLAGIILNLVILGINSGISRGQGSAQNVVFYILILLLIVVNLVVEMGLIKGRQTRKKLLEGLLKMYKDQGVEGYYDPTLVGDYRTRYNLFMIVVLAFGFVALVVPFVIKLV